VPAYNERPVIVSSIRSLLASEYEPLEILIVDDGSTDGTLQELGEAFDLIELPVGDRLDLETEPVEQLFVSRLEPRLRVARKQNGAARTPSMRASTLPGASWSRSSTRTPCSTVTHGRESSRSSPPTPTGWSPSEARSGSPTGGRSRTDSWCSRACR
jgi:hypothetical protein